MREGAHVCVLHVCVQFALLEVNKRVLALQALCSLRPTAVHAGAPACLPLPRSGSAPSLLAPASGRHTSGSRHRRRRAGPGFAARGGALRLVGECRRAKRSAADVKRCKDICSSTVHLFVTCPGPERFANALAAALPKHRPLTLAPSVSSLKCRCCSLKANITRSTSSSSAAPARAGGCAGACNAA